MRCLRVSGVVLAHASLGGPIEVFEGFHGVSRPGPLDPIEAPFYAIADSLDRALPKSSAAPVDSAALMSRRGAEGAGPTCR